MRGWIWRRRHSRRPPPASTAARSRHRCVHRGSIPSAVHTARARPPLRPHGSCPSTAASTRLVPVHRCVHTARARPPLRPHGSFLHCPRMVSLVQRRLDFMDPSARPVARDWLIPRSSRDESRPASATTPPLWPRNTRRRLQACTGAIGCGICRNPRPPLFQMGRGRPGPASSTVPASNAAVSLTTPRRHEARETCRKVRGPACGVGVRAPRKGLLFRRAAGRQPAT
jgi:hypothetical protein